MSNKKVMSHDPLADMESAAMGDVPAVPQELSASQAQDGGPGEVLVLPDCLTIAEVGDFYPRLTEWLESGGPVSIDASAVETIDGAGLQLLAAFVKDLKNKSGSVTWVGVSAAMQRSAARMGINGALQLEHDTEAA